MYVPLPTEELIRRTGSRAPNSNITAFLVYLCGPNYRQNYMMTKKKKHKIESRALRYLVVYTHGSVDV